MLTEPLAAWDNAMNRNGAFVPQPGFRLSKTSQFAISSRFKSTATIARHHQRPIHLTNNDDYGGNGRRQNKGNGGGSDENRENHNNFENEPPPPFIAPAITTPQDNDSIIPKWARTMRITTILLLTTVFIFLLQLYFGDGFTSAFMKLNLAISAGEWYRLFTPIFLHGGFTHLLVNCLSLHYTGPIVESWYGKTRFIALYIFSGFCGNIASFLATPNPGVGASGAIFGLIGGFAVLLIRHRDLIGRQSQSALQSLALTVAINFAIGLSPGSYIDNFAHLGGLLGGLGFAYIAGPRLERVRSINGTFLIDRPLYKEAASEIRHNWDKLVKRFSN